MNRLEALEAEHRDGINLSWLVKLRWAAMAGQLVTIGVVHEGMGIALRLAPFARSDGAQFGHQRRRVRAGRRAARPSLRGRFPR